MRRAPVPRACPRGFTLLELLVALSIAAIIALALYSTLGIAFRARNSAEAATEPVRTAELALGLMRSDVESALPPRGVLAGAFIGGQGTEAAASGAEADSVQFYTLGASPGTPGAGEVRRVELLAVAGANDEGGLTLVRRVTDNLLGTTEEVADEILCRGVRSFNVRYFDGLLWQDLWDSTQEDNQLPAAVEVILELERPAGAGGGVRVVPFRRVILLSCSPLKGQSLSSFGAGEAAP